MNGVAWGESVTDEVRVRRTCGQGLREEAP